MRDFAAQRTGGKGDFADAVHAWLKQCHPRVFHPYAYFEQDRTLVDALASAGVVSSTAAHEADDDEHDVEDLVVDKAVHFKRADAQQRAKREQDTRPTAVLMGFLSDNWFTLPCDRRAASIPGAWCMLAAAHLRHLIVRLRRRRQNCRPRSHCSTCTATKSVRWFRWTGAKVQPATVRGSVFRYAERPTLRTTDGTAAAKAYML